MLRKKQFTLSLFFSTVIVFALMWSPGIFANGDHPPVSVTTIIYPVDPVTQMSTGAQMSINTDTFTKYTYCAMEEHYGNSSCRTATPSDHPISTKWDPSHRKLIITIEADVAGYGQAKASVTSGHVNIGDQKIELTNLGGDVEDVGTWDDPMDVKSVKYTPTYEAYFICPIDIEPDGYTYSASGKVELWGIDWEGTGTISITNTVGVSVGLDMSGTYQVSTGVSASVTSNVSGNASDRFRNHTDVPWTVAHSIVCGHVQCWKSITDPHAHHWWCLVNENGCGDHIKCKDYIPAEHVTHEKCWNHTHGCEETDVRRCTHECAFAGVFSNGTDFNVNDTLTVKVVRKNLGATTVYFKKPGDTGEFGVRVASSGTPDGNGIEDDFMVFNITFSEEDVGTFTMNIHIFEEGNYLDVVEWWVAQITVINVENSSTDDDDDGTCGDETIWGTTYGTSGCGNPRNENSCTHPYIVAHYTIMWCEDCNQYYRKCSPPDYCSANHRNAYEIECLDATPNCDDCYDGRSDCTNASAH